MNDLRNNKENEGVKTDLLVQKLIASLDFTEGDVTALYKNTVGQLNNLEWTEQRKGCLTASKFKSVYTRAKTLEKDLIKARPLQYVIEHSWLQALEAHLADEAWYLNRGPCKNKVHFYHEERQAHKFHFIGSWDDCYEGLSLYISLN